MLGRLKNYYRWYNDKQWEKKIKDFNRDNLNESDFSDFSKHYIISGESRGGTTWLLELLQKESDCVLWEPLYHNYLIDYRSNFYNDLGHMPYVPAEETYEPLQDYFNELFKGQLPYGLEVNRANGLRNLSGKIVCKFCRANMLLPWINRNYPEIKIIYLVRNPLAVISSMYRHPAFKNVGIEDDLFEIRGSQGALYNDIFERFSDNIAAINTRASMFANWWAIQNYLPLKGRGSWLTVSYENLYLNPTEELQRMAEFLGLDVSSADHKAISKPSSTTQIGSGILTGADQLVNYRKTLSKDEINDIVRIVEAYGINVYGDQAEPNYALLS